MKTIETIGYILKKDPEFIFFVTKQTYSAESIYRAAKKIGKYLEKDIHATKATVNIYNKNYTCIRIKNCHDFDELKEIHLSFRSEGFKFAKLKNVKAQGLIKIQKRFYIEEIENGIYKDLDDPNYAYFELPKQLSWEEFRSETYRIKNLLDDHTFDAALGVFNRHKGITDIVRIYKTDINYKEIELIKDKFYEEIKSSFGF